MCILTSFWVHIQSWMKYLFGRFQTFFPLFNLFHLFPSIFIWDEEKRCKHCVFSDSLKLVDTQMLVNTLWGSQLLSFFGSFIMKKTQKLGTPQGIEQLWVSTSSKELLKHRFLHFFFSSEEKTMKRMRNDWKKNFWKTRYE